MESEGQSVWAGPLLLSDRASPLSDGALLDWMADEGMLDWITVEVDHG